MKKNYITILTITTLSLCLLVGCGQPATPNTNEDTSTEQNTEVEEKGNDVVIEMFTEEPRAAEVIDGISSPFRFKYAYISHFPEGITGLTTKYLNEAVPEWSLNETHYMDTDGNIMNFQWEGFVDLGKQTELNGNTLNLIDPERGVELRAWHCGYINIEDIELCLTADTRHGQILQVLIVPYLKTDITM